MLTRSTTCKMNLFCCAPCVFMSSKMPGLSGGRWWNSVRWAFKKFRSGGKCCCRKVLKNVSASLFRASVNISGASIAWGFEKAVTVVYKKELYKAAAFSRIVVTFSNPHVFERHSSNPPFSGWRFNFLKSPYSICLAYACGKGCFEGHAVHRFYGAKGATLDSNGQDVMIHAFYALPFINFNIGRYNTLDQS